MLTGDKGETAKNIAISCGLIDKDNIHKPIVIDGVNAQELEKQFDDAIKKVGDCDGEDHPSQK